MSQTTLEKWISNQCTTQSIYPLAVFVLVALDKAHHSREDQSRSNNNWSKERSPAEAVTITFEIDVERSRVPVPSSTLPKEEMVGEDKSRAIPGTKE